ncbi:MAG: D-glycero-beta-D-manno-heptose-7-phosphate kinase [Pseudomonadota bacterium]
MFERQEFDKLLKKLGKSKILLIGDVILDTFVYGQVSRISPEGPIPVLTAAREDQMLGGAGNVLANLIDLGASVDLIGLIGKDDGGSAVKSIISDMGGKIEGLIEDQDRPTIQKTRYQARSQQLLRVDYENVIDLSASLEETIKKKIKEKITDCDCLILSDYGKGLLSDGLLSFIMGKAKRHKVPVVVDPKGKDYSRYKGATLVTPNRDELSQAANGAPTKTDEEVLDAMKRVIRESGIKGILATRSEDGMTLLESKRAQAFHLKTKALEVYDVSGAGDTVVATIGAIIASGGSYQQAAYLANIAGGLVVAKIGTATIKPREILQAVEESVEQTNAVNDNKNGAKKNSFQARLYEKEDALKQIQIWQDEGLKVGFTNGCFDILHHGHVSYLNQARGECDRLVLGLNHDQSVKILKGPERPINDEQARASVIGALGSVDMVVLFGAEKQGEDNTPCSIIGHLKPDLIMKGGDYKVEDLPEAQIALSYGGDVKIMPLYDGYSTTNTIEKMQK